MKNYNIYVKSNNHPRTINTPTNGRTYFTEITVQGMEELKTVCAELIKNGERISEITTDLGTRYFFVNGEIIK